MQKILIVALVLTPVHSEVVYRNSTGGIFNISDQCPKLIPNYFSGSSNLKKVQDCVKSWPVLEDIKHGWWVIERLWSRPGNICKMHSEVCQLIPELREEDESDECLEHVHHCRSALLHLHAMLFNKQGEAQVCNNFARKSIRGYFHDHMSSGVDGSVLAEHDVSMNFGLCRWAQYINVLSDHTGCDPGSIIVMAATLGYQACGVDLWLIDESRPLGPSIALNRPNPCGPNIAKSPVFDKVTGQRKDDFSDVQAAVNGTAMEQSWFAIHSHMPNLLGYGQMAGALAHMIGRVTCPPEGVNESGHDLNFKMGLFHMPRVPDSNLDWDLEQDYLHRNDGYRSDGSRMPYRAPPSYTYVQHSFLEGMRKMKETQCHTVQTVNGPRYYPTGGYRLNTTKWPLLNGETNFNPEGGYCSMPITGNSRFGNPVNEVFYPASRWIRNTESAMWQTATHSQNERECRSRANNGTIYPRIYLPWEVAHIQHWNNIYDMPNSSALQRFLDIAWNDDHDSANGEWDSCEVGCRIPILESRLCNEGARGLEEFDWDLHYCSEGLRQDHGYACCNVDCGKCEQQGCEKRWPSTSQCCPGNITSEDRLCISAWDVGCVVPKLGDGGRCVADDECKSDSCKGGFCCNTHGAMTNCAKCGIAGGSCIQCASGFKRDGPNCVQNCSCHAGCLSANCSCGVCTECDSLHYLPANGSECRVKKGPGKACNLDIECSSGTCRGGNCCYMQKTPEGKLRGGLQGTELQAAEHCVDCNQHGLCAQCEDGYALCGKWSEHLGKCKKITQYSKTSFRCERPKGLGTSGYPSSDNYDYCRAGHNCPCPKGGCYVTCDLQFDCWDHSLAKTLTNYTPTFTTYKPKTRRLHEQQAAVAGQVVKAQWV